MVTDGGTSRRSTDLTPEDAEFVGWAHDGYPAALRPLTNVHRFGL